MPRQIPLIHEPRYQNPALEGMTAAQGLAHLKSIHPAIREPVEVWQVNFRRPGAFQICTAPAGSQSPENYLRNLTKRERRAVVDCKIIGTIYPEATTDA